MRRLALASVATASVFALSACTTSAKSSTGTTPTTVARATSTTADAQQTPAVSVLPVTSCPTSYGVGSGPHPFVATHLPAATSQSGLAAYSNGLLTVLGPAGWTCSALVGADGGQVLSVYPPGQANPSLTEVPPGTAVVQLEGDYTGHGPGAELVCPLFPHSAAAGFMQGNPPCPAAPKSEIDAQLTTDIVTFTDPPGVRGTGTGSGGTLASSGAVVYPQITPEPAGGVNVAVLSCTLPSGLPALCSAIRADFLVRQAPAYEETQG